MNPMDTFKKIKTSFIHELCVLALFIITGIIGRTVLVGMQIQPFPNFEIIMVLTFLAVLFIRPTLAFLVPLFAMIGSDLLLGNAIFAGNHMNKIILFTYTGFLIVTLVFTGLKKQSTNRLRHLSAPSMGSLIGTGIVFVLIYDLWTNIGWWYLMYPHTLEHLSAVIIAGVPFMVYHMLSTAFTFTFIAIPVGYLMFKRTSLPVTIDQQLHHRLPLMIITIIFLMISFLG